MSEMAKEIERIRREDETRNFFEDEFRVGPRPGQEIPPAILANALPGNVHRDVGQKRIAHASRHEQRAEDQPELGSAMVRQHVRTGQLLSGIHRAVHELIKQWVKTGNEVYAAKLAQLNERLEAAVQNGTPDRNGALRTALHAIAKGEGPFSRDPLTHAENTINSMKSIAVAAIADDLAEGLKGGRNAD